jgi:nicotinate-nucleotide pyrophosphorylase (carboxylating)
VFILKNLSICPKHIIAKQVSDSLIEDLSVFPDWTANLIPENSIVTAKIKTKEDMVICGIDWVNETFRICEPNVQLTWYVNDGDKVPAGTILCAIKGLAQGILNAERTALNFLQTLSATATMVNKYVAKVQGTLVKIMDTRKTIPGLRLAQKYAVTVGGGHNQRVGLYGGVLIKENHIMACGGIKQALDKAMSATPKHIPVQIEVETLAQLEDAIQCGANLILLDNMSLAQIKQCVEITSGKAELEVSGNVNLENVRDYALTCVDRISIGALTKNIQAIDLSLRVTN